MQNRIDGKEIARRVDQRNVLMSIYFKCMSLKSRNSLDILIFAAVAPLTEIFRVQLRIRASLDI